MGKDATYAVAKRKPKKIWLHAGCRRPDLCDTGAALQPIEVESQLGAGH